MSFNWHDYLSLARGLAGKAVYTGGDEAKKRSAISRAYYAALIKAREKASARSGQDYPHGGTHQWTISKFKGDPAPDAKRVGSWLKRLKKARERADYESNIGNLDKEVDRALDKAEDILTILAGLNETSN